MTQREFIQYTIKKIREIPGNIRAELERQRDINHMLDNLTDHTLIDRLVHAQHRPIEKEPKHIPVRGDQDPERIFVRIIRPRFIDGIVAR